MTKSLSRYWLLLGVSALAIAGLYSLVLVIARTPSLAELPLFAALFHEALVVHVDLSVLVWFLSIACLMWSLLAAPSPQVVPYLEESALVSFALGTLAIAASPLDPHGGALMSNYIPVITSPVFFLGLALLLCGVALMLVRFFTTCHPEAQPKDLLHPQGILRFAQDDKFVRFALLSSALIATIAIMAFVWSYQQMPKDMTPAIDGQQYYELLFWGGGHVLQFLHTQILLVCWILLAVAIHPDLQLNAGVKGLFFIGLFVVCTVPTVYLSHKVDSPEHREFFMNAMITAGGIAPAFLACYILPVLWRSRAGKNALWSSLCMSILLFLYGGILGEIIRGQNVVIPAHYHGSIVGITLAFMGAAYLLLPQFGYKDVRQWRMAFWQPVIYGGGQLLHISGLAWSGGYGVLRKTPGGLESLSASVKVAMGIMGIGGLIAIIGGLMFVVVVGKAVMAKTNYAGP